MKYVCLCLNLTTVVNGITLMITICVENVHNYHTRISETVFFLPRFNSKIGHKLLSYQRSKLWVKLPLYLKNISHFGKFQDELKSYLLNSDSQGH